MFLSSFFVLSRSFRNYISFFLYWYSLWSCNLRGCFSIHLWNSIINFFINSRACLFLSNFYILSRSFRNYISFFLYWCRILSIFYCLSNCRIRFSLHFIIINNLFISNRCRSVRNFSSTSRCCIQT